MEQNAHVLIFGPGIASILKGNTLVKAQYISYPQKSLDNTIAG